MRPSFWLLALIAFVPHGVQAQTALPDRPHHHVNDYAQALAGNALAGLEQKFAAFEAKTGHQAAVAIFADLGGAPVDDFANKLFTKWRLGRDKQNDGILLVLGLREHALRIEVGYGLEGQLPDALAGRIIREEMVPFLKQGQVATAVLVFEKRLEDIFVDGKNLAAAPPRAQKNPIRDILIALIVMIFLYSIFFPKRNGRSIGAGGVYGRSNWWWWLGGGGGGWGGGSGGGWGGGGDWGGGGGGMSGGGGASGSW